MPRKINVMFLMLVTAPVLAGCSNSNLEVSEDVQDVHPSGWYLLHRSSTSVTSFAVDCGGCHVVKNLSGPSEPPGCFSTGFDDRICHAKGPGQPPHPMDGSFLQGNVHGKVAKTDLTFCQSCHSSNPTGGPGSNPRFDVGIYNAPTSKPGTGCEQCHGINLAHPSTWAGPGNTFHYSAGNVQGACTLCHGTALNGVDGVGVDCTTCHAETTSFTLDCTACHQFPPDGVTPEPVVGGNLVPHTSVMIANHDQCATCHGMKNTNTGSTGNLNPSANYLAFNKTTDTIGDHWNGKINMNADTGYSADNFGCDMACHLNNADFQLRDSNLQVALGNYGTGGVPHAVGQDWLRKSQHAAQSVNGSFNCTACHLLTGTGGIDPPCQGCHRTAPIMDPAIALTNDGCISCHGFPPDGAARPNTAGKHSKHVGLTTDTGNCSACHQGAGSDTLDHYDRTDQTNPREPAEVAFLGIYNAKSGTAVYDPATKTCASVSCHGGVQTLNWESGTLPDPAVGNDYCLNCHTLGTAEYNGFSSWPHETHVNWPGLGCVECHNLTVLQSGVNNTGPTHWSNLATSVFELDPARTIGGMGTSVTSYEGSTCGYSCHEPRSWFN